MTSIIKLSNVYVAYSGSGRPALIGVNLSIGEGVVVLITGPNGAGKTTLLETCLGLLKPIKGYVRLLGVDTRSRLISRVRRLCGYLPQDFMRPPYESFKVKYVIAMGLASLKGAFEPLTVSDLEKIRRVARDFGIEELLDKPIGRLSGGQQQRVFLARVFVRSPKVLFLDEPFSSLDRESRRFVAEYVRRYVDEHRATALVVSHDTLPLNDFADMEVELVSGRVVRVDTRV